MHREEFGSNCILYGKKTSLLWGSTWTIAAIPFFGVRQTLLWYKQHNLNSLNILYQRDRNEMIASVTAGIVLGMGSGYYWSIFELN